MKKVDRTSIGVATRRNGRSTFPAAGRVMEKAFMGISTTISQATQYFNAC